MEIDLREWRCAWCSKLSRCSSLSTHQAYCFHNEDTGVFLLVTMVPSLQSGRVGKDATEAGAQPSPHIAFYANDLYVPLGYFTFHHLAK